MTSRNYEGFFNPYIYLDTYYKNPKHHLYFLRKLNDFWSQIGKSNLKVLEYGGGPSISKLASACPYVKEFIFAEYLEANRKAVQDWIDKDQRAFDWKDAFEFIVQELEGKGPDQVIKRQDELRQKIQAIVPCDIKAENLLDIPANLNVKYGPPYDVVSTSLCLEVVVDSEQEYQDTVIKLAQLVKPGGYLVMHGAIKGTFYTVGSKKFYSFPLTKEMIEKSMENAGVKDVEIDVASDIFSSSTNFLADTQAFFFVYGKV